MIAHQSGSTELHTGKLRTKRPAHIESVGSSSRNPIDSPASTAQSNEGRKRMRTASSRTKKASRHTHAARHPLGIKPLGNAFLSERNDRSASLGLFACFEDEFLLNFLSSLADDPQTLARLEAVSHGLYVFINGTNTIWRDAFLSRFDGRMKRWCGSWKRTFMWHSKTEADEAALASLPSPAAKIQTPYMFSDVLYHPFRLSMAPMEYLVAPACKFLPIKKIDVATDGSVLEFRDKYALRNLPAILQNAMLAKDWPCRDWNLDKLAQQWPDRFFQCEAVKARLPTYLDYSRGMQHLTASDSPYQDSCSENGVSFDPFSIPDESPFYLFDASFADDPQASMDWRVPDVFQQMWLGTPLPNQKSAAVKADLLSLLGPLRPDHRWIIAGPTRSGSGWHKDPNGTSAWNAVLTGRKAWMMLPPHVTPPGVYVSDDEAEVTAPLSIAEWLLDFAQETRRLYGPEASRPEDRLLLEGVCEEGEVLYVPSGWWHLVINLEESVALTQNFVSPAELGTVLDFMKNKSDQLSGFKKSKSNGQVSESITLAPGRQQTSRLHAAEDDECDEGADFAVFDMFCERLANFDQALLAEGLERVAQLEASRLACSHSAQLVQQRIKMSGSKGAGSWWEQLKKQPDNPVSDAANTDALTSGTSSFSFSNQLLEDELEDVPW